MPKTITPKTITMAALMALAATAASPETAAAPNGAPEDIAQAFIGSCLQNSGDYQRMVSWAEALKFERIEQELDVLGAPKTAYEDFAQYKAKTKDGAKYLFGAARTELHGAPIVSCSIGFRDLDVEALASTVQQFAGLGAPQHEFTEMGQHYRIWMPIENIEGSQIILMDGTPMQMKEGSLGFLSPETR